MVDGFLNALGVVAFRDERTGLACAIALLHPRGLGQRLVVRLHAVHDDSPLALCVDGPERHEVVGGGGTEVGLLGELHQSVHAVLGVGEHVFVERCNAGVVVFNGL